MTSKPNILFIVADDLNAWIGALGRHPQAKTPAIDALAGRGALFTRAYCQAPYCNASRMSVFTGCLPSTTGIYATEDFWSRPDRRLTYIEALQRAGYFTFGAGKVFHGKFDYRKATFAQASHATWRESQNRPFLWDKFLSNESDPLTAQRPVNGMFDFSRPEGLDTKFFLFDWGPLPESAEDEMPDSKVARSVIEFLRNAPPAPFFCAAGLYKPHLPWYVPARFFNAFPLADVELPFVKADDLDDVPEIARSWALSPPDHEIVTSHGQWRHAVQGYLASVAYCDFLVGRLIAALDRSAAADNTIIVLWGDNGFHLGEKLHWRKFVLWEEATHVPLIVVPPRGVSSVPRVVLPVGLMDLFPTLFDLCGIEPIPGVDGMSLLPAILGDARGRLDSRPAISTWGRGNHSVRADEWRYTRYRDGSEELYDQSADPHEWNNLADDPRFAPVRARLSATLPNDLEANDSAASDRGAGSPA